MSDDVAIIVSKSDDESPPPKVLHKENSNLSGAATPAIILSPAPSPDHSKEEEQKTEETKEKQSEPDKTPTPVQKEETQESMVQQETANSSNLTELLLLILKKLLWFEKYFVSFSAPSSKFALKSLHYLKFTWCFLKFIFVTQFLPNLFRSETFVFLSMYQSVAFYVFELRNPWKVKTTTGSESDQGTSSPVVVVLYGDKGQSELVVIGENEDFKFTESKTDEFDFLSYVEGFELLTLFPWKKNWKIHIRIEENIGEVYKVRVGFKDAENEMSWYEGSTEAPSWFLEKMEITDVTSNKVYEFEANQWIWFDGYNDFWREFPVKKPKKEDELLVLQYHVDVYTSNEPNAGTDANVYVQIFGERGDTGRRRLLSSQSNTRKFEQGAIDQFEIEAVDLGKLEKVKVGHDGENPGSGWMLEKIVCFRALIVHAVYQPSNLTVVHHTLFLLTLLSVIYSKCIIVFKFILLNVFQTSHED
ncbi:hypothetical protein KUTeg_016688 [Tegillarca granosa]|uniref:PLAT domain-containing protein n=1 Tax=Tegillarca granosa TaxID=220873 RepID=A0ABQ9ELM3_TEGGR|nr:hypothetical protein KUTeg_016688 [Tegillarca granosa]